VRKFVDFLLVMPLLAAVGYLIYAARGDGPLLAPPTATGTPTSAPSVTATVTSSPTLTPTITATATHTETWTPLPSATSTPVTPTESLSPESPAGSPEDTPPPATPVPGTVVALDQTEQMP
jgi:hypothetical protein